MLGKLLKYEFKATGRVLLPLYGALLVMSVLIGAGLGDWMGKIPWGSWYGVVYGLMMLLYGCVFGAALVVTVLLLIQRFYKNLLRDEGYLMNTLPVAPWQNVAAKLICATVWSVVGIGAATLSVFLMGMDDGADWLAFFHDFGQIMAMMTEEYGANVALFAVEGVLAVLVALAQSIVSVYLALAIGHMANRAKIMWSVVAYVGISVVEYLGVMLAMELDSKLHLMDYVMQVILRNDEVLVAHGLIDGFSLLNVLLGGAMFAATAWILKRRLNLE